MVAYKIFRPSGGEIPKETDGGEIGGGQDSIIQFTYNKHSMSIFLDPLIYTTLHALLFHHFTPETNQH